MPDDKDESLQIKETDIVFDCPYCSKSLAIDYRGAGLSIPCSDCGKYVQVPIPEGMELADIDSSEEEQEMRILNLRRGLSASQFRIRELETEIQELHTRRTTLERTQSDTLSKLASIQGKVALVENQLTTIAGVLKEIVDVAGSNSQ
ncbi:MAG: hypothetical protein HQ559_07960 [Lentisphaerae bacterium]|nr:hypothetical protein [Lentisphaerota bacterium]